MANIKNLAVGTVLTPPSGTSGVTVVMQSGQGTRFPAAPFYATGYANGVLPSISNAEIVLVTAVSSDTFTITRAQKGTTAQTWSAGWILSNAIYAEDLFTSSITYGEILGGTPNGVLTAFTVSTAFTAIEIFKNGTRLTAGSGNDYTTSGTTITFVSAPATGAKLVANYIVGSSVMVSGSNSRITDETPVGLVNSSNATYTTNQPYIPGTLQVFINGVKQKRTIHFTESSPTVGTFVMSDAPLTGDDIMVSYLFTASTYGNAQTVNGYGVSATPAANQILPLDSTGYVPMTALKTNLLNYFQITSTVSTSSTTPVAVTGLSATVTIPSGGRSVKITAFTHALYAGASASRAIMSIWDGAVGTGTQLNEAWGAGSGTAAANGGCAIAFQTPAAGTKTYSVGLCVNPSSTAFIDCSTTSPAFISVELV